MPAQWRIEFWPRCDKHVYLCHCAEDRQDLVDPVFQELGRRGVVPWFDRHHYPAAREALETLREELLKCRHVVYFITPAMLRQGRGWAIAERAFAGTIQQHLRYGDEIAHVELPLLFLPRTDPIFQRSLWRSLVDKAADCPHPVFGTPAHGASGGSEDGSRDWRREHVQWAADTVETFVRQEEVWALDLADRFRQDSRLNQHFSGDNNLMRRLLGQAPRPLSSV